MPPQSQSCFAVPVHMACDVIGIAQHQFFEIQDGGHVFCTLSKSKLFLLHCEKPLICFNMAATVGTRYLSTEKTKATHSAFKRRPCAT